jgi:hypothetical protein
VYIEILRCMKYICKLNVLLSIFNISLCSKIIMMCGIMITCVVRALHVLDAGSTNASRWICQQ